MTEYEKNILLSVSSIYLAARKIEVSYGSIDYSLVGETIINIMQEIRIKFGKEEKK